MRLIIYIVITAACGYIGLSIRKRYKSRYELYFSMQRMCVKLNAIMKYERTPLYEALCSCSERVEGEAKEIMRSYAFSLNSPLSPKPPSYCNSKVLSNEENKEIDTFLEGLGKSDAYGQSEYLEYYTKVFAEYMAKADAEIVKKGEPAAKLGVLIGIFICVLTV